MRRILSIMIFFVTLAGAEECTQLESAFDALDQEYRMARTIKSPTARYDYYYRYLSKGTELMARCRSDQRNYKYAEIVRKLRMAQRDMQGLRQRVIEEQWQINDVKPIIKYVYRNCSYPSR